jgi:hypothetical protein
MNHGYRLLREIRTMVSAACAYICREVEDKQLPGSKGLLDAAVDMM